MSQSIGEMTFDTERMGELRSALLELADKWSEDADRCDAEEPEVAELIRGMMGSLTGVVSRYEVTQLRTSAREDGAS